MCADFTLRSHNANFLHSNCLVKPSLAYEWHVCGRWATMKAALSLSQTQSYSIYLFGNFIEAKNLSDCE